MIFEIIEIKIFQKFPAIRNALIKMGRKGYA